MDTSKVTRFEIINHTACDGCDGVGWVMTPTDSASGQSIAFQQECRDCNGLGTPGRTVYLRNPYVKFELQLQDDGKTLKMFIEEKETNENGEVY